MAKLVEPVTFSFTDPDGCLLFVTSHNNGGVCVSTSGSPTTPGAIVGMNSDQARELYVILGKMLGQH